MFQWHYHGAKYAAMMDNSLIPRYDFNLWESVFCMCSASSLIDSVLCECADWTSFEFPIFSLDLRPIL